MTYILTKCNGKIINILIKKDETNVPENAKGVLRSKSPSEQWKIICSYQQQQNLAQTTDAPGTHVEALKNPTVASAQSLRLAIAAASVSWMEQFIQMAGLSLLMKQFIELIDLRKKSESEKEILNHYVHCFFGIANLQVGFQGIINANGCVEIIVHSLSYFTSGDDLIKLLELLAGMALLSDSAHGEILRHIRHKVIDPLIDVLSSCRSSSEEKEAILTFFNALINRMDDVEAMSFRKKYQLDLVLSLVSARPSSKELHTQLDTYQSIIGVTQEMPVYSINSEENAIVQKCKDLTSQLIGFDSLLPILSDYFEHLSFLPRSGVSGVNSWKLIDNAIQCAMKVGPKVDETTLIKEVVTELAEVYDISISFTSDSSPIKENENVEVSQDNKQSVPVKPEKEVSVSLETPKPPSEKKTPKSESIEQKPSTSESVSAPTPVPESKPTSPPITKISPDKKSTPEKIQTTGPAINIPPPTPGGIPPPPGIPGAPPIMGGASTVPKKPVIKPNIKMRRFNWTKINYRAAQGSFWENVNESKYDIDSKKLELVFGIVETKKSTVKEITKPKTVHLLETRRSQNLCMLQILNI